MRVGSPGGRRPPARAGTAPPDAGQLELPADKKAAAEKAAATPTTGAKDAKK